MADLWQRTKTAETKKPTNWGKYIEQFRQAGVDNKITTILDNIKNLYRNPIAHPEHTLTDSEAMTLFSLGIAAVQQMVTAIGSTIKTG